MQQGHVDPRTFGDPVAVATAWTPTLGYSALLTRNVGLRLVEISPSRLELRRTVGPVYLGVFGLPLLLATLPLLTSTRVDLAAALGILPGLVPALAWLLFGAWLARPTVFDRHHGAFWVGWLPPRQPGAGASGHLREVRALQLLRFDFTVTSNGKRTAHPNYQMNVILRDGRRVGAALTPSLDSMRADAYRLQRFLTCKLWDATHQPAPSLLSGPYDQATAAAKAKGATRSGTDPDLLARHKAQPWSVPDPTQDPRKILTGAFRGFVLMGAILAAIVMGPRLYAPLKELAREIEQAAGEPSPPAERNSPPPDAPPGNAAARPPAAEPVVSPGTTVAAPAPAAAPMPIPEAATPSTGLCDGIPLKFLSRCREAEGGAGPCAGKPREQLIECFLRNPDPRGLAQCAELPMEQRGECAFQFFLAQTCRNEPTMQAMDACWDRERAKYDVPKR